MGAQTPFHQFMTDNANLVGFNILVQHVDYGKAAHVYAVRGPQSLAMVCVPTDVSSAESRDVIAHALLNLRLAAETAAKNVPEYFMAHDDAPLEGK